MYQDIPLFETHDYIIGGKMVVGRAILDDSFAQLFTTDVEAVNKLKDNLIHQMAQYMIEHNLVEFTQMKDPISLNTNVAVRAYLAPSDQVKILRLANKVV
jgi:hypothetical protein